MQSQQQAFFRTSDGEVFIGNDPARGPWQADACHAGPVSGVIARAFEKLVTDKQLMRLTIELGKPVPMAGFRVEAKIKKSGRAVTTAVAELLDLEGRLIASASSLHMVEQDLGALPTAPFITPNLQEAQTGDFPIKATQHGLPSFNTGIEVLYPPGQDSNPGPTTLWMKTLPIVEGEVPTAFQRLCPLADCGNGISRNQDIKDLRFLNPDITIIMHRASDALWLGSQAQSFWQSSGLGMSQATLFDEQGPIGSAMQTLLLQKPK